MIAHDIYVTLHFKWRYYLPRPPLYAGPYRGRAA